MLNFSASVSVMEQPHWVPGGFMEDSRAHTFPTLQATQSAVSIGAVKDSKLELRPKRGDEPQLKTR